MDGSESLNYEDTLPDEAWKDSFDKLLDQREALRSMNIIKRDIRASFNMNSSFENSCYDVSSQNSTERKSTISEKNFTPKDDLLKVSSIKMCNRSNKNGMVSTPVKTDLTANPFKCTLSPICNWSIQTNCSLKQTECKDMPHFGSPTSTATKQSIKNNFTDFKALFGHKPQIHIPLHNSSISPIIIYDKALRRRKQVCFNTDNSKTTTAFEDEVGMPQRAVPLPPGKWRKSLSMWRRTLLLPLGNGPNQPSFRHIKDVAQPQISSTALPAINRKSTLNRKYLCLTNANVNANNFEYELIRRCGQSYPLTFEGFYTENYLQHCCKIGEGAFGEVFLYKNPDKSHSNTVFKIIPIEGKVLINGEVQKSFEQILQEVVICMELSALNDMNHKSNFCPGFVNIEKVKCVVGQYPAQLQKLWEEYDEKKQSENEHPGCFDSSQQFVVLDMAFSGEDLESFTFRNGEQAFYALLQIIYTLAVGEEAYQFEHRDLHLGNVLVLKTSNKYISYKIDGKILALPTKGVRITIIDYTLSRITYNNGCYFNDLSCDEDLFTATGDYQFDIYRMMREILNDKWEMYEPKTNIFWISYIISKMLDGVSYKNFRSKVHLQYMKKLSDLKSSILTYTSCKDSVLDLCSNLP